MSMVTLKPIYYLQKPDGTDRQYEALTPEQYKELVAGGVWVPVPGSPNPVVSASRLLTINGERAVSWASPRACRQLWTPWPRTVA